MPFAKTTYETEVQNENGRREQIARRSDSLNARAQGQNVPVHVGILTPLFPKSKGEKGKEVKAESVLESETPFASSARKVTHLLAPVKSARDVGEGNWRAGFPFAPLVRQTTADTNVLRATKTPTPVPGKLNAVSPTRTLQPSQTFLQKRP